MTNPSEVVHNTHSTVRMVFLEVGVFENVKMITDLVSLKGLYGEN